MISHVSGSFKTFEASIYTTGRDFTTAEVDLWIDAASISTGNTDRDVHLIGADFFDADTHKQITFTSSTIGKADADGNQALWGEMTIKGVTRNQKLNVVFGGIMKDPWGKEKAGFTISGKFNRSDWGLTWNTALDTGGLMVSDEVSILCELELVNVGNKDLKMELESMTSDTK